VRRNDRGLDVRNGDRATVTAVDPAAGTLTVRTAAGERTLPRAFLERCTHSGDAALQHGYALTAYVAQGLTCERTLVLVRDHADREWAYTALSRGRERNQLYTIAGTDRDRLEYAPASPGRDPDERLTAALNRSRQQQLALDQTNDVLLVARSHDDIARLHERRERSRSGDRGIGRQL
jgi:ATP-dependent exoDNAse (exonuclease V) alpha subunit